MTLRKISASQIYTNRGLPLTNAVLVVDPAGVIVSLDPLENHDPASVEKYEGILTPGFVNAHCHLELSHMKGKVSTGTGLVKFIEGVVSLRGSDQEEIQTAIDAADEEMWQGGIVAVGDICNKPDTFARKDISPIHYHSFVEMFDFWQDHLAQKTFEEYKSVYDNLTDKEGHRRSAVPHAPYSVSRTLFRLLNDLNSEGTSISIHNQETLAEELMFRDKSGDFLTLFGKFGFTYDHFEPTNQSSIHYAIQNMDPRHHSLFVHNTLTNANDVKVTVDWNPNSYWVSCPNANLYIENRLPDYQMFLATGAQVCLGTDSLTSNWQLSILEEIKTIRKYQSFVPQADIIRWATLNGAKALNIADQYGSLEVGKAPGINLISVNSAGEIDTSSNVQKVI
ncbi:MAG: amidohydrolase family protein [Saprospiraceae bacterium]|nr:amidohydrolase family protein [Saprospiraceae bacterium]